MNRRRVLLVSNRRPEDAGGRAEKVATRQRLLADHGWDVTVGYVTEPYVLTFPSSVWRCLRVAREADVDAVLSINNPFHLHLAGYLVARRLGVPWVAEFRDPILPRPDLESGSLLRYPAGAVERLAATRAERVLWYDGIQMPDDYFETTYPDVDPETFVKLPFMGYEKAKFYATEPERFDRFTITYAGSFYEGWIEPYGFLAGLGRYTDRERDPDLNAQFYGDWTDDYDAAATTAGVTDLVSTHEFVPHEEIVPILKGSDAVLYVGGDDPDNARNVPSKIFDYVGARTPILAIVDPDFRVASFIEDNGLGVIARPDDPEAIADAIEQLRTGAFEYNPDPEIFDRYTREASAERIAGELDAAVTDSGRQ
jgi:glycosyltransferase involved in cell wall biosynthesis